MKKLNVADYVGIPPVSECCTLGHRVYPTVQLPDNRGL